MLVSPYLSRGSLKGCVTSLLRSPSVVAKCKNPIYKIRPQNDDVWYLHTNKRIREENKIMVEHFQLPGMEFKSLLHLGMVKEMDFGSRITLKCAHGHVFATNLSTTVLECGTTSLWLLSSGVPGSEYMGCQPIECKGAPPDPPEGAMRIWNESMVEYGDHAEFKCQRLHFFIGKEAKFVVKSFCTANGNWSRISNLDCYCES